MGFDPAPISEPNSRHEPWLEPPSPVPSVNTRASPLLSATDDGVFVSDALTPLVRRWKPSQTRSETTAVAGSDSSTWTSAKAQYDDYDADDVMSFEAQAWHPSDDELSLPILALSDFSQIISPVRGQGSAFSYDLPPIRSLITHGFDLDSIPAVQGPLASLSSEKSEQLVPAMKEPLSVPACQAENPFIARFASKPLPGLSLAPPVRDLSASHRMVGPKQKKPYDRPPTAAWANREQLPSLRSRYLNQNYPLISGELPTKIRSGQSVKPVVHPPPPVPYPSTRPNINFRLPKSKVPPKPPTLAKLKRPTPMNTPTSPGEMTVWAYESVAGGYRCPAPGCTMVFETVDTVSWHAASSHRGGVIGTYTKYKKVDGRWLCPYGRCGWSTTKYRDGTRGITGHVKNHEEGTWCPVCFVTTPPSRSHYCHYESAIRSGRLTSMTSVGDVKVDSAHNERSSGSSDR
ncbi:hypothetical protein BKA62DRAFT_820442 [Auriculariales sp. MPI-PUGE-AT-0066]|nr:hypothetical protein BKA62DRAFT_820442 [Auriculariales sp. MPI-PUGE-AT-0066]